MLKNLHIWLVSITLAAAFGYMGWKAIEAKVYVRPNGWPMAWKSEVACSRCGGPAFPQSPAHFYCPKCD